VHRWSDHPEIINFVESIWNAHFAHLDTEGRSGPKPKRSFKQQLRVVLLDLYVAWLEDPELCIGVALSENDWKTWSRYNALGISKKIVTLIHLLEGVGLIDLARGSYSGPWAPYNRTTRIRAAEPLQAMFRQAKFLRDDIQQVKGQECIVLKGGDGDEAKVIDYEDTDATKRMRKELDAYNLLLADTFLDIPTLDYPWVTRTNDWGRQVKVQIDHHHQFVRRIFSRGEWNCNGRFYGPWWQQIDSKLRSQIFINDTPTVEVDFKGLHVAILSAEKGVVVEDDPYELPAGTVPGAPPELQRKLVKKLVLTALNARSTKAAFGSFRDGFPSGHMAKGMTNLELDVLLSSFKEKHPYLADDLCADRGIRLMNVDAQIAALVHRYFTIRNIPVLSVHDSFIVDYTRAAMLKRAMGLASRLIVGRVLRVDANSVGLDEFDGPVDHCLDFEAWRQTARSAGYLSRLQAWEERKARGVVSSRRG